MASRIEVAHAACREIVIETHELYMAKVRPALERLAVLKDRADLGPSGYDPLFGPPLVDAEIFFIGFQPGGGPDEDNTETPGSGKPYWPAQCVYATADWKLARLLQGILTHDVLLHCTGSERQFFRAASDQVYASWPKELRIATESFSLIKLRKMLEVLTPKRIVFIGKKAMHALLPSYDILATDNRGHFRIARGSLNGIPAMGCAHLSGARINNVDMAKITTALRQFAVE